MHPERHVGLDEMSRRCFLRQMALAGAALRGAMPSNAQPQEGNVARAAPTSPSRAQVSPILGTPTLVIDDKPHGPMFYTPGGRDAWERGEMARRNFRVFFEMVHDVGWPGQQETVFRDLDRRIEKVLADAPDARIVLRVYLCNPRGFAREYPQEIMAFQDGQTQHFTKWYNMDHIPPAERGYSSFASPVWREKTAEALRHYVEHVRGSNYARHVIGYFLCGGGTEEWYYYENFDETKYCLDFSPPMKAALRSYLRARYGGDVGRLRAAWADPTAAFETAQPPDTQRRFTADAGVFWDPAKSQAVRDYYYVHNKVMEDAILHFSKVVKEACRREQIVGLFYGSLQNMWPVKGGQATFKELLQSPDIDFWSSPPQYDRRGAGEHGCIRFLNASLKKHGKLWISESDIRTVLSREDPADPTRNGRTLTLEDSLACLQREFAHLLCEGANGWWLQPQSNDYRDEQILSLFARMQELGEAAMRFDRTGDTDIAAVVDQESLLTGPAFSFDTSVHLVSPSLLHSFRVQEMCRIGAPVDCYELDDILAPDARRYRLYLMLNCFSLTDVERRGIDRLRRDGAILVWMYAPGVFHPGREPELSLEHAKLLLGLELGSEIGEKLDVSMKLTQRGAEYFTGFDCQRVFGSLERPRMALNAQTGKIEPQYPGKTTLRERFFGAEGGEVLARFEQGGRPSITVRRLPGATDIWIGSVMAPADLLRIIARHAGCHLFCNADEIVYANRSFLAIHAARPGKKEFALRRPADVIEIFSDQVLGQQVLKFADSVDTHRTRLYFIGDLARWIEARRDAKALFSERVASPNKGQNTLSP